MQIISVLPNERENRHKTHDPNEWREPWNPDDPHKQFTDSESLQAGLDSGLCSLTWPWARRKHQRGCASSGRPPLRTPWQNTRAPASGSTQTGWPGTGGGRCWRFRKSSSRTSDWQREEETVWVTAAQATEICTRAPQHLTTLRLTTRLYIFFAFLASLCLCLPVHLIASHNVSFLQSFDGEHLSCAFIFC